MDYYSIVDFNIAIHENFDKKATLLLKAFKIDTSSTAENKEECVVQIVHINSDDTVSAEKKKYYSQSLSGESVCYGIVFKQMFGEWKHCLARTEPLTEGFMVADEAWGKQIIIDDCRVQDIFGNLRWKRRISGKRNLLDEDNEWIELFLAGFYSFAALHGTMLIHASAVKYQDKAVLFTAPSGTGKTTQAELWKKYAGAEILNGDRVFIRSGGEDEKLYAWGSPWAGSSPYIVNDCAELAAVVVLRQANENRIRRMEIPEAVQELSDNSFLPMWDAACLEGMLGVMDRVIGSIPVYLLECRPDAEAVNTVMKEVFGKGITS